MTTYSETHTIYGSGYPGGPAGRWLLDPLYELTRRAPGCSLTFTGTGSTYLASVVLSIPSTEVGFSEADTFGPVGRWRSWYRSAGVFWLETDPQYRMDHWNEQMRLADILLKPGMTITCTASHSDAGIAYNVFTHAQNLIFRPNCTYRSSGLLVAGAADWITPP